VLVVSALDPSQIELVDRHLPLHRLDRFVAEESMYLVAWEDERPVGHAHVAWQGTHLGVPELQDVFVVPERRRRGIARRLTEEAEREAARRGFDRISLSVSAKRNEPARRLYESLGYRDAGVPPVRVEGTIVVRGRPLEVDDTLVYYEKPLG
jgi:GNAT superfamily N-acetyltransferase